MTSIAVIGAGSWGTALAWLLGEQNHRVLLWARDPGLARRMQPTGIDDRYLPEIGLPSNVRVTSELVEAVVGRDLLLIAVPSVGMPAIAGQLADLVHRGMIVTSATKELDHETGRRMTVVLGEALPDFVHLAALSGPNLAHEIVDRQPSASVVGAADERVAAEVQAALTCEIFRVYAHHDVAGVELGGALKNPLAIAAGICDGLGYGDNSKAALISRGIQEIWRLGVALGAKEQTFTGLCGFGDLLATCHSRQSRNRNLGEQLGRGRRLAELLAETTQVAEGVPTCRTALKLAREHGVEMPILSELARVLFEGKPILAAGRDLMLRETGAEFR